VDGPTEADESSPIIDGQDTMRPWQNGVLRFWWRRPIGAQGIAPVWEAAV